MSICDYPLMQKLCALRLFGGAAVPPPPVTEGLPLSQTHQQALARLQDWKTLESVAYMNRRDTWDADECHPDIVSFARRFTATLRRYGVPAFVHNGYRSGPEQDALFAQGVTKARAGQSAHNFGAAVDVVHYGFYWDLTPNEWAIFGAIGKDCAASLSLKITWGGDWSFWDPAHWELREWRKLPRP